MLKFAEGLGKFFKDGLKTIFETNSITKMSYLVLRTPLKSFFKGLDPSEIGGVPLLGIKGNIIKCHGRSDKKAIKNAIKTANNFAKGNLLKELEQELKATKNE